MVACLLLLIFLCLLISLCLMARNPTVDVFPKVNVLLDPPHDFIIPREKSLNCLQDFVRKFKDKDGKVNTIYIIGSQGTGKTELARQYGNFEFDRHLTRTVVHLNMISETVFKESLIKVITEIDLQKDTTSNEFINYRKNLRLKTVTDLMKTLQSLLVKRPEWLLIVDDIMERNVTECEMYKMLPQPGSSEWGTGRMIVTTRLKLAPYDNDHVQTFHAQGLDIEEAKKLLYLVTRRSPREKSRWRMEHIAYRFRGSPKDIVNAGFCIRKCKILDEMNTLMPHYSNWYWSCCPCKDGDILVRSPLKSRFLIKKPLSIWMYDSSNGYS